MCSDGVGAALRRDRCRLGAIKVLLLLPPEHDKAPQTGQRIR
jgi:hypothetical protein